MELAESGILWLRCPVLRYTSYGLQIFTLFNCNGMVLYRRNRIAGGTYFFTVTLRNRSSVILVRNVGLLRDAFRVVRRERPFNIDAIVILPEHLHTIWTMPDGDSDYSGRWRAIKSHFTRKLIATGMPLSRDGRGEYRLWQSFRVLLTPLTYIHVGNDGFGNTTSATTTIINAMLITSTGIR